MKKELLLKSLSVSSSTTIENFLEEVLSSYLAVKESGTVIKDDFKDAVLVKKGPKDYTIKKGSKLGKPTPSLQQGYYGRTREKLVLKGDISDDGIVNVDIVRLSGSTAHSLINGYPTSGKAGDKSWNVI